MQTVFQCEWDKHATRILERHWPDVPRWGDVSTLTADHILTHAPIVDIVAWGSPCQDLSVAGKRAGLDGSRSGLFHEGMRIIRELREATNGRYPKISVWENVYGALNSNQGADFGRVIDEMAAAGALVQEWRVLDAQYFGVPQRRRRVFLVSIFDPAIAERCPDPLLPVREGVHWHPSTSRPTRQTTTRKADQSLASGHRIANTISAELYHRSTIVNQDINNGHLIVESGENETLIAFSHTQGLDAQPSTNHWPTLRREGAGHAVMESTMSVRRLTPLECERLMGWPDNWTEGQADSHRYKQCGNGVASPVAEWIGQQLQGIICD